MKKQNELKDDVTRILSRREVCRRTSLSPTTLWKLEKSGAFPKRRRLGLSKVGYLESEIDAWIKSRAQVEDEPIEIQSTQTRPRYLDEEDLD